MRWDYQTFQRQPAWFIDGLMSLENIDNYFDELEQNKLKSQFNG